MKKICRYFPEISYLHCKLGISDKLTATEAKWEKRDISFVAAGAKQFAVILGSTIPDLAGERKLVISNFTSVKQEDEDVDARAELFHRTEKPNRRVLKDEVETNTSLDKMKAELFATGKKEPPKEKFKSIKSTPKASQDERNELFAAPKKQAKKEASPVRANPVQPVSEPENQQNSVEDLDAFKAELLGEKANLFPDAPVEPKIQPDNDPVDEEESFRAELFAKKADIDPEEPFADIISGTAPNKQKCAIDNPYDLPEPETLNGAAFLDDDDLL